MMDKFGLHLSTYSAKNHPSTTGVRLLVEEPLYDKDIVSLGFLKSNVLYKDKQQNQDGTSSLIFNIHTDKISASNRIIHQVKRAEQDDEVITLGQLKNILLGYKKVK
jgi:hypothetical protein